MTITIGDIATTLRVKERWARSMLYDVNPEIDRYAENPDEIVARETVIDLFATREDTRTKKLLGRLLGEVETQDALVRGIDPALYREVRRAALEQGTSANAILRDLLNTAMRDWLNR